MVALRPLGQRTAGSAPVIGIGSRLCGTPLMRSKSSRLGNRLRSTMVMIAAITSTTALTREQLAGVELALAHYLGVQDATPPRSS